MRAGAFLFPILKESDLSGYFFRTVQIQGQASRPHIGQQLFFDGRTVEAEWQNKRNMPKHTEERKQHMREVMIQKWRERHGESNNDTGNDNPVHSDTN